MDQTSLDSHISCDAVYVLRLHSQRRYCCTSTTHTLEISGTTPMTQKTPPPSEHFVYEPNNEEEAEIAQLSTLFETEHLVRQARARIDQERSRPSRQDCAECGEPIPTARQQSVPGVQLCIECAQLRELKHRFG